MRRETDLEVGVVEVVLDVPAEHEELASLDEDRVEVDQTEQQLLVLLGAVTSSELLLVHSRVHALHVRLESLITQFKFQTSNVTSYYDS